MTTRSEKQKFAYDLRSISDNESVKDRTLPLMALHPDVARYPSQSMDGGSRSTDSTSSVERAVLHLDPIQTAFAEIREIARRIAVDYERWQTLLHRVEKVPVNPSPMGRTNAVDVCTACGMPCVPTARYFGGVGPFDESCYRSWYRAKNADQKLTYKQWFARREPAA